ncbi:MAG: response regulator transcription factor [Bacteroidia bacterium]|nr:response regulator transcription factor [Bacteroidia bacterium]
MKRIFIIEDDPAIREGLEVSLRDAHYEVEAEADGERGFVKVKRNPPDAIILDLMLPSKNGEDICRDLRAAGVQTPILMLTSKGSELDTVLGLELGADDYMTKPFSLRELHARIKALLRRAPETHPVEEMEVNGIWLNTRTREVLRDGSAIDLSTREFDILTYMMQHKNEVITRDMLLDDVWGYEHYPTTRTVDNYILSLRKKIEPEPSHPRYIITIHTSGYKFIG